MHVNKIHAIVTTWLQEQFFNPTPILTHRYFLKQTSQRFSSKQTCQISNLNKSLIAGDHVYLNCRRIFSPPNRLMSARYETPLLVDVKIEELKI